MVDGGWHIEQRMKNAGFVDVQCVEKTVYYGDWNGDPNMAQFWREWKMIYSGTIEPIVLTCMESEFPHLRDREKFARDALRDYLAHNYPMYAKMYVSTFRKLFNHTRCVVIGRRPETPAANILGS